MKPDILLLDLEMPKHSGLEALRELSAPSDATLVRVILLTAAAEKSQIVEALQLGARGVVLKDSATQLLLKAIQTVMAGEYWVNRESVSNLPPYLQTLMQSTHDEARQNKFGLTPLEREINAALEAGYSNKEIAEYFNISEDTVKHHLSNIFDKLGIGFWGSLRHKIEAIDPLRGIYTVLAISILAIVLSLLSVMNYGGWR